MPTGRIADYILETNYESLPEEVIHQFKRTLLDYMSVTLLGSTGPVSQNVYRYQKSVNNGGNSTVLGREEKMTAESAAFINGTSSHSFELDDGHRLGAVHPASVVFSSVLALAEAHSLPPGKVIESVVIGYDLVIRIATAMHPKSFFRGFHNTPTAGVLGSAGACAKLLGLNRDGVLNALGLAGSFAGGIRAYMQNGADIKRIHPGKAARDGIVCAELAKTGITGPPEVLAGENGFYKSHAGDADLEVLLDQLGKEFQIMNIYFKPYPVCRHLHGLIDCILQIKQKRGGIDSSTVTAIKVGTYKVANTFANKSFAKLLETQTSIPCAVAAAIVHENVGLDQLMPETFAKSPAMRELVDKTEVYVDDDCENSYPQTRSVKVSIELSSGETIKEQEDFPRGSKEKPLSDKDLEGKLMVNCEPVIGTEKCRELIRRVWDFENRGDLNLIP